MTLRPVSPMIAVSATVLPSGEEWSYEVKWDGYRSLALKDGADVRLVSFSVDPENDTPAVLAQYATRYQAQPNRWHFLTGPRATLDHLARDSFKLNNVDASLNHSTRLVLLDRQSRIRGYYGTSDDNPVIQLMYDIKRVLGERS